MRVLNLVTSQQATFFRNQRRALAARGVESETVAVRGDGNPGSRRSVGAYAGLVPRTVKRSFEDFDLVHANNGLTAPAALAQYKLPVVVSLWGTDLFGRYGRLTRAFARHADDVIVMTEEMADALDRDAHVIPHGVELDAFEPRDQGVARDRLGWRRDRRYVLFPYSKDRAVKNYPRAKRIVDAAGREIEAPVELRTVTGVDYEDMSRYYAAADALLLTSNREGSPNAVKEALACDTPVVSVDVGDVADRLEHAERSRIGRSDAELTAALADVLESEGTPGGERRAVTELGLEQMARDIHAVYESVLDTA